MNTKKCKTCGELITETNQILKRSPVNNKYYVVGLCKVCNYRANEKRKNVGGAVIKCVNGKYWCKGCSEWLTEERFIKKNKSVVCYCKDCQRIQRKCKKLGIEFKPKVDVYTLLIGTDE